MTKKRTLTNSNQKDSIKKRRKRRDTIASIAMIERSKSEKFHSSRTTSVKKENKIRQDLETKLADKKPYTLTRQEVTDILLGQNIIKY